MASYEIFLEKIAELLAMALTDEETQYMLSGMRRFADKIKELSSQNISVISQESTTKRRFCQHDGKCRQNALRGFLRAFSTAFAVKYGVGIVQALLTRRGRVSRAISDGLGWDTVRFATFFGAFIGGFKGINCTLRKWRDKEDRWNAFFAGAIAALALGFDEKHRRTAIALYFSSRALQAGWTALQHRKIVPEIPHGDTLLMGLCNMQIIYAYLAEPETLAPSYYRWIDDLADLQFYYGKQGIKDTKLCLRSISTLKPLEDPSILERVLQQSRQIYDNSQYRSIPGGHSSDFCALVHPETTSCTMGSVLYSRRCFPKTLRIYFPLNLSLLLLWKNQLLLKNPQAFVQRLVLSSLRSSAFITLFAALAWLPPCYIHTLAGRNLKISYFINGFLSGSTVLMEQPRSRRLELAMYCLPRALESLWNMLAKRGRVPNIPNGEVLMFSMAMGSLLMLYQNEPDTVPDSYKHILVRFFGAN